MFLAQLTRLLVLSEMMLPCAHCEAQPARSTMPVDAISASTHCLMQLNSLMHVLSFMQASHSVQQVVCRQVSHVLFCGSEGLQVICVPPPEPPVAAPPEPELHSVTHFAGAVPPHSHRSKQVVQVWLAQQAGVLSEPPVPPVLPHALAHAEASPVLHRHEPQFVLH